MNNSFDGSKILNQITAKLVPPDHSYPDSLCKVIMTKAFLYVLEDNYDGTFNIHFKIPLEKIVSVEKYNTERGNGVNEGRTYAPSKSTISFLAIFGLIYIPLSGKKNENANQIFLKVFYKNESGEMCTVFFENCSSIKNMVRAFRKYVHKERNDIQC